eukprot:TRINITY_DN4292_c0_g1_i7.p1 TRINITY_DN4292_c0_g1~~TRINITY_DN4292_c0_g1_i7.p1  ORF type:complete len:125 (-),score=7.07 TRINITY_DN4292_c0_g1_i7:174-548(-)
MCIRDRYLTSSSLACTHCVVSSVNTSLISLCPRPDSMQSSRVVGCKAFVLWDVIFFFAGIRVSIFDVTIAAATFSLSSSWILEICRFGIEVRRRLVMADSVGLSIASSDLKRTWSLPDSLRGLL